jgi:hypothetical protein
MPDNVHRIIIPVIVLTEHQFTTQDLLQLNRISKEGNWGISVPTDKLGMMKKLKNGPKNGGLR